MTLLSLCACPLPTGEDTSGTGNDTGGSADTDTSVDTDTSADTDTADIDPVQVVCPQCIPEPSRPGAYRLQLFPTAANWTIVNGAFAEVAGAWVVDNPIIGAATTAYTYEFPLDAGWILMEIEVVGEGMKTNVEQSPAGEFTGHVFGGVTSDATITQIFQAGEWVSGDGSEAAPYVHTGEHIVEAGISYYGKVEGSYEATLVSYDLLFRVP